MVFQHLLLRGIVGRPALGMCFLSTLLRACAVSCCLDRSDNLSISGSTLYAHRIRQQADGACRNTRHLGNCLFNPVAACCAAHTGYHKLFHSTICPFLLFHKLFHNFHKLIYHFILAVADILNHAGMNMLRQQLFVKSV